MNVSIILLTDSSKILNFSGSYMPRGDRKKSWTPQIEVYNFSQVRNTALLIWFLREREKQEALKFIYDTIMSATCAKSIFELDLWIEFTFSWNFGIIFCLIFKIEVWVQVQGRLLGYWKDSSQKDMNSSTKHVILKYYSRYNKLTLALKLG